MAKKKEPRPPKDVAEVQDYIIQSGCLKVDAQEFYTYYQMNNWYDKYNEPVLVWKLKVRMWQSIAIKHGDPDRKCSCGKYAEYVGKDDTGQIYFKCADHKPIRKCALPPSMTKGVLQDANKALEDEANLRRRRNQAVQLQAEALRRTK